MAFNWRKFPWTNLHDLNLDWIIQTVKTLEGNLADAVGKFTEIVNTAITNTLTGSGDLTISKTGDVNISGAHVNLSNTYISAGSEQLTLHNPNSNKSMTANYNSGVLTLSNNQELAKGVAVYPINTPADGGGDNSTFAANVGYVKDAVAAVDGKLDTEISNRTSGDAALQSTIDGVIMPLINAVQKRAPRVFYFSSTANPGELSSDDVPIFKQALVDRAPIILVASPGSNQYSYYLTWCGTAPTPDNINTESFYIEFRTLDGLYKANITLIGATNATVVNFDTIS